MKSILFILLFLISISFMAQEKIVVHEEFYPDGTLAQKGEYKGAKKNGVWVTYEVTGKIKNYFTYRNGTLNGFFAEFDVYGKILREGFVDEGNRKIEYLYQNGILWKKILWLSTPYLSDPKISAPDQEKKFMEVTYDLTSGNVRSEGIMINGKKDSVWIYYNDRGEIKGTDTWKDGVRDGPAKKFYPNGALAERANFLNGKFNGERLLMTMEGDTTEYGNYKNNLPEGYFMRIETVAVPDLIEEERPFKIYGTYKEGKMHGKFILKHENGKTAAEENYQEGKLNGERKLYNEKGDLVYSGFFDFNKKNGTEKFYYDNGKTKKISTYINGVINGTQELFFESGKLSEQVNYENGKIQRLIRFYENGKIRQKILYKEGAIVKQEYFNEQGKKVK